MVTHEGSRPASAEQRLKEIGIQLPAPPEPFGTYAEAVQTGNLVSGHPRIGDAGEDAFFGQDVAVADTARQNPNPHLSRTGLRDFSFDQIEVGARPGHLHRSHRCHLSFLRWESHAINVEDRCRKGFRSFLGHVVADALENPVRVPARELLRIGH